jgi:hypothetical protein
MIYLGILIGFILGVPIGFIKWKKKTAVVEKYSRRGLFGKSFSVTDNLTNIKSTVECNFEIGEWNQLINYQRLKLYLLSLINLNIIPILIKRD